MKKIKDFLLSLILPSKMYKHHNMRFIYSLGIFILSTLIFDVIIFGAYFETSFLGSGIQSVTTFIIFSLAE